MELFEIYFIVEKNIVISEVLKQMMHNKLITAYDKERNGYLINANKSIEEDVDILNQINEELKKDKRQYESFSFKSNVIVQQNEQNWFMNLPIHTYQIKVTAKSIIYKCLKITDSVTFIGFDPSNKEIITFKKESSERVYFNE